jgi:hypothetical protein
MKSITTSDSGKRALNVSLPFLFALMFLIFLSGSTIAQSNFSGSWAYNESKSALGEGPMMSPTAMTINQQAGLISIDIVQPSFDGGEEKRSEKYTLDGKESANQGMMNSSVKTIVTWSDDKKELKFAKNIIFDMNGEKMEAKSTEVWSLSADGKTLTMKFSMVSQMGEINSTLVYDKK